MMLHRLMSCANRVMLDVAYMRNHVNTLTMLRMLVSCVVLIAPGARSSRSPHAPRQLCLEA